MPQAWHAGYARCRLLSRSLAGSGINHVRTTGMMSAQNACICSHKRPNQANSDTVNTNIFPVDCPYWMVDSGGLAPNHRRSSANPRIEQQSHKAQGGNSWPCRSFLVEGGASGGASCGARPGDHRGCTAGSCCSGLCAGAGGERWEAGRPAVV